MPRKTSNTGIEQVKKKMPVEAEPYQFKPGDPRINRNGRPRKADMLREAFLEKWDSPILENGKPKMVNGKPVTYGDFVTEKMFRDAKLYPELLNRAFGKVKDEVEMKMDATVKQNYDMSKLTTEELKAYREIARKAKVEE